MNYDYVIIGSDINELIMAYYLSKIGKSILIVDNNKTYRYNVNIYSDSFVNLINFLKDEFKIDFYDLFIPMKFNSTKFFSEFMFLIFNENNNEFLDKLIDQKYSINFVDHIDSVCKIMLGKSYYETTVTEFVNLINKEIIYNFYQPKEPIYDKLYKILLENIKNCHIELFSTIGEITGENNIAQFIEINNKKVSTQNIIYYTNTKINKSISMTFHWDTKIDLQNICNLPNSDWELFFIVQSDYTYYSNIKSQTVISVKINNIYANSLYIQKNALECNNEELINETFRQLKEVFINLTNPTDIYMINNENNLKYDNFKNIHVLNNNDSYDYIENLIIKSKKLIYKLENKIIKIYESDNLTDIIKISFIINIFMYFYSLCSKKPFSFF